MASSVPLMRWMHRLFLLRTKRLKIAGASPLSSLVIVSQPATQFAFRTLHVVSKHFAIDTFTYMPVHHGEFVIGSSSYTNTHLLNDLT